MSIRLAIAALLLSLAFGAGWKVQGWRYEAAKVAEAEAAAEAAREARRGANTAAKAHEVAKAIIETKYVTITQQVDKIVERPIYRNVCLDADGLRALDDALGAARPAAGKPGATLP